MWPVFAKTMKGYAWPILAMAGLVAALGVLVSTSYEAFGPQSLPQFWEQMPKSLSAFMRADGTLLAAAGPQGYITTGFRHPIFLIVIAAFAIATASGALAREIEHRTILVLLARPLQRYHLVLGKAGASAIGLIVLVAALLASTIIGVALKGLDEVEVGAFVLISVNAACLALAILGYSYLFSALSNDGGRAILLSTAATVVAFFLDFVSRLFEVLEPLGLLSIFHYYDPISTAIDPSFPAVHVGVLLTVAAATFAGAVVYFQTRDIAA